MLTLPDQSNIASYTPDVCLKLTQVHNYSMYMYVLIYLLINPLRTVVAYMRPGNKYFTVHKQIIITSPAFTL